MERVRIRVCTANDIDSVIALERQWEQEEIAYGDFNPMSREAYVAIPERFLDYFLVAENDGQLVGYIHASVQRDNPVEIIPAQEPYVESEDIYYPWQFPKERFGARLLHERTQVPVAYPYLLETSTDIFGWPYLLMPRLHGSSPADPHWTDAERLDIAQALAQNLFHLHQLPWPFAGVYDHTSDTIQPFGDGFAAWIVADIRQWLACRCFHRRPPIPVAVSCRS